MSDIEIQLYDGDEMEPVTELTASYEDAARMESRELVNKMKTALSMHVDGNRQYRFVLKDKNRPKITRTWTPIMNAEGEADHDLEIQLRELVAEWRRR